MNILTLSATFPYPPTKGGTQVRTFHLVRHLSQRHHVTLLTQQGPDVTEADRLALSGIVGELQVFPRPTEPTTGKREKLQRLAGFIRDGVPPNVRFLHSPAMQAWVDQAIADRRFDVITCEHSVNESYIRPEWQQTNPKLRTVVDIHSSVYATCRHQLATGTAEKWLRDRLTLPLLKRYERAYCQKFSTLVVTTEDDRRQMSYFAPETPIFTIPNGVDFSSFPYRSGDPGGHRLIFCGAMDNQPNIDAVQFLCREVFPFVRDRYPDATLALVGSRPGPDIQALGNQPGITVTGRVPSMTDYLHQATVCVVSMRTGFGIKNKTLEAMAAGVPVVGSDRGLEGLDVDGRNGSPLRALRANRVGEYVEAIARLFEDAELREQLSREGRSLIEAHYTWESAGDRYEQAVCGTV